MRSRLLLLLAAAAVAGALIVVLSASQQWGSLTLTGQVARQHVSVSGRQVSPALSALAVALIAVAVAVVAARGLVRRLVAVVGAVAAVIEVVVAFRARNGLHDAFAARVFGIPSSLLPHGHASPWWIVAAVGGVLAATAFALVAIAGGKWRGMGARYDAPQAAARRTDPAVAAWEALDRGDDPTA
jgi:uncharacterized membrane protein (TIGR02234 family)